jgi:hypothetical protein
MILQIDTVRKHQQFYNEKKELVTPPAVDNKQETQNE